MKTLDYPDIETDRLIIANFKMNVIRASGLVDPGLARTVGLLPFTCPPRGYIVGRDNAILMIFDPAVVDAGKAVASIHDVDPPFEVYLLEDNEITDYFEIS